MSITGVFDQLYVQNRLVKQPDFFMLLQIQKIFEQARPKMDVTSLVMRF